MAYEPIIDRVVQIQSDGTVVRYIKANIDSTDSKPMKGIAVRSELFERDTGKLYLFTEEGKWVVPDDISSDNIKKEVTKAVDDWLDNHPEATTSVEDHSLTMDKMVIGTLGYVTPEMYGAVGDGITDDYEAINEAIATGKPVVFRPVTYLCTRKVLINNDTILYGNGATIKTINMATGYDGIDVDGVEGGLIDVVIYNINVVGNRSDNPTAQSTGINLQYCNAKLENVSVEEFTNKCINFAHGKSVFRNITMKNVGKMYGYCFVYLFAYDTESVWDGVYASNDEYDPAHAAQTFYIAKGNHTITNVHTHNVNCLFDARNATLNISNCYCYKSYGIKAISNQENYGSNIVATNLIYDQTMHFGTGTANTIFNVNCVKTFYLTNCTIILSEDIKDEPDADHLYLMRFDASHNELDHIGKVYIDGLKIIGDDIINSGIYVRETAADTNIELHNCEFPRLKSEYAYYASMYGNNEGLLSLINVTYKDKTQNLYAYDTKTAASYEKIIFKKTFKQRGTTAERPVLSRMSCEMYFDTDLNKAIMWNGTSWVNLDGTSL